ncbi:MAG: hypothetical protein K8R90_05950 [Candidatus Cloacimonetes bacterium]|nr:hypothetical protein [Candidatus Cloacimonadota bacterium]
MKYSFAILRNENEIDHQFWIEACQAQNDRVQFDVIDLTRSDWLQQVTRKPYDMLIARPPGITSWFKQLYDERIYIIHDVLKIPIYPSCQEIFMYENKRMMAYWLAANKLPYPHTWVFYNQDEALEFSRTCQYPLVAKTAIGSAGSGVKILTSPGATKRYINQAFSNRGITRKWGPNLRKVGLVQRAKKRLKKPGEYLKFITKHRGQVAADAQCWFVIFQEYHKISFEWRAVKIGDSYFAHKKIATRGNLISGSSQVSWDGPSPELLDFLRNTSESHGLQALAFDLFETEDGKFLINELQCYFGSFNPHQMILDGKPGRYRHIDNAWRFEPGEFNTCNSHDLRLLHILQLLDGEK